MRSGRLPRPSLRLSLGLGLLTFGCTEYGLAKGDTDITTPVDDTSTLPEVDTADTFPVGDDTAVDSTPPETGTPSTVPCDDVALESLQWWGSQPFPDAADPVDGAGRAWYRTDYDMQGWSTVVLPDSGHIPSGNDRTYRGTLHLDAITEAIYVDLQSDDGLTLYVNGALIGQWGGAWQEEGCVNDEARCLVTSTIDPVEVTRALVAGDNLFAARVSNAVDQTYFQLHARCAE